MLTLTVIVELWYGQQTWYFPMKRGHFPLRYILYGPVYSRLQPEDIFQQTGVKLPWLHPFLTLTFCISNCNRRVKLGLLGLFSWSFKLHFRGCSDWLNSILLFVHICTYWLIPFFWGGGGLYWFFLSLCLSFRVHMCANGTSFHSWLVFLFLCQVWHKLVY